MNETCWYVADGTNRLVQHVFASLDPPSPPLAAQTAAPPHARPQGHIIEAILPEQQHVVDGGQRQGGGQQLPLAQRAGVPVSDRGEHDFWTALRGSQVFSDPLTPATLPPRLQPMKCRPNNERVM